MLADRMRMAGSKQKDPFTKALLHMDGANGSTIFKDEAGKIWTPTNATIATAQSKFGGASGYFNGTGWIDTPAHDDFSVGSGDFTVDFWIRPLNSTQGYIFGQSNSTGTAATTSMLMFINSGGDLHFTFQSSPTAWAGVGAFGVVANNNWYHVAVVRNGNNLMGFLNGVLGKTTDITGKSIQASIYKFAIGRRGESATTPYSGYIDEFRFTKGNARWMENFTPPTAPYAA